MDIRLFAISPVIVVAAALSHATAGEGLIGKIEWKTDLNEAHAEAVRSNRPMVVIFESDRCTWCRKMDQTTLADPQVKKDIVRNFVPVRLDFARNQKVTKVLKINRAPCAVILSPRADLLERLPGFVGRRQYRISLARSLALHQHLEKQYARQQPKRSTIRQMSGTSND